MDALAAAALSYDYDEGPKLVTNFSVVFDLLGARACLCQVLSVSSALYFSVLPFLSSICFSRLDSEVHFGQQLFFPSFDKLKLDTFKTPKPDCQKENLQKLTGYYTFTLLHLKTKVRHPIKDI